MGIDNGILFDTDGMPYAVFIWPAVTSNQVEEVDYLLWIKCKCFAYVGVSCFKLGKYFYV